MHAPAYGRLDGLRALSTKGHGEGAHQGTPLPLANIRTRSPARKWRRQPATEDDELLAEQACRERGDARRDMSRMLILRAQHGKIETPDARGEAGRHTARG